MSIADRGLDASLTPEVAATLERMKRVNPDADPLTHLPDVDPRRIPRHVAIIMDGNGRWAEERGFPRVFGHRNGAIAVREVVKQAGRLGIEYLTLFSFSSENWRRPTEEINALMQLCIAYCQGEQEALRRQNIRVRVIGSREGLPPEVLAALDELEQTTGGCTGPTLCLAINYGARTEIVDAARALAREVAAGRLDPDAIDERAFEQRLYTRGIPDPDLLIRTAGQLRVSNYLLWQISYAEIHVSELFWPDFGPEALNEAVREFSGRDRRFGGLSR